MSGMEIMIPMLMSGIGSAGAGIGGALGGLGAAAPSLAAGSAWGLAPELGSMAPLDLLAPAAGGGGGGMMGMLGGLLQSGPMKDMLKAGLGGAAKGLEQPKEEPKLPVPNLKSGVAQAGAMSPLQLQQAPGVKTPAASMAPPAPPGGAMGGSLMPQIPMPKQQQMQAPQQMPQQGQGQGQLRPDDIISILTQLMQGGGLR